MKLAILVASHNCPERLALLASYLRSSVGVPHDLFVAQAGVDGALADPNTTLWYRDSPFRGVAYGHLLALERARLSGEYDYVWIVNSDLEFEVGIDCAQALIALLKREPRMAIAAPTLRSRPSSGENIASWKAIATCESLGFVMRMAAIDEVGFLDPTFRYGWGAMDELAYRLYCNGWFLARAQGVGCHYLAASAQGHDLSFDDYWKRARRFAFDYFRERFGEHWDGLFWSAVQGHGIEINAFREHKRIWAGAFSSAELLERSGGDVAPSIVAAPCESADNSPARAQAEPIEPWPLATESSYRLLAWPDYRDERELEQLFDEFARVLVERSDACLCLRFDEAVDGAESAVVDCLQRVHKRVLGDDALLEVLLVDDVLSEADLPRLGAAVIGCASLPSNAQDPRHSFFAPCAVVMLKDAEALRSRLDQLAHPRYGRETLDSVDFALVRAIGDLHPWASAATLGNLSVRPGHGTNRPAAAMAKQAERRMRAIVAPIVEKFELEAARVLELGAGFGLFSAQLVAHGAKFVVMAEQRSREQRQAELYWSVNGFLPREDWRVLTGSLALDATWDEIENLGQFDVVLWTDALVAKEQVAARVRQLSLAAARLFVLDLSSPDESSASTGFEEQVSRALRDQGFELGAKTWTVPGQSADESSMRTVLFASKSKVIRVPAAALPARPRAKPAAQATNLPRAGRSHD